MHFPHLIRHSTLKTFWAVDFFSFRIFRCELDCCIALYAILRLFCFQCKFKNILSSTFWECTSSPRIIKVFSVVHKNILNCKFKRSFSFDYFRGADAGHEIAEKCFTFLSYTQTHLSSHPMYSGVWDMVQWQTFFLHSHNLH